MQNVDRIKKALTKKIEWLGKYIARWEKADGSITQESKLCVRLEKWCKRNNLALQSADELKAELEMQLDCVEQGKF